MLRQFEAKLIETEDYVAFSQYVLADKYRHNPVQLARIRGAFVDDPRTLTVSDFFTKCSIRRNSAGMYSKNGLATQALYHTFRVGNRNANHPISTWEELGTIIREFEASKGLAATATE